MPCFTWYDPRDYVRKTDIDLVKACPKQPDLKDYVLKSTIPPIQKCPSCVCPKVKIEAGLTKDCPKQKNNCPRPQPCGVEQCKTVIKCEPGHKQVHCPKCPEPKPCPQVPEKVCPALSLPKQKFKCPEPKPCAAPTPCRDGEGRCPEQKCPKCEFKGVDTVVKEKSTEEMVSELLNNEDPKLKELLEVLKKKLNIQDDLSNQKKSTLYKKLKGSLSDKLSDFTIEKPDVVFDDYIEPTLSNNSITTNNNTNNKMEPEPFTNYNKLGESDY